MKRLGVRRTMLAVSSLLFESIPAERIAELRSAFRRDDYVEIPEIVPRPVAEQVAEELAALLDRFARRYDVTVSVTGNSPRRYAAIGRDTIAEHGTLIARIYRSDRLLHVIGQIAGEEIVRVPYVPEEFVATRMDREGDTHGWHWDDYGYALVWVVQAPSEEFGGSTELVRGVSWDKQAPRVEEFLATKPIERHHPKPGSLYLLKADATLHRVAPLRAGARREIICYSYASVANIDREISHETVEVIYGEGGIIS
jgi:hypothetical protein